MLCNICEHKDNDKCTQGRNTKIVLGKCESYGRIKIIKVE